jgi:hypothetical protein
VGARRPGRRGLRGPPRRALCGNPLHFHAWCRLPNQLQHEDIRERALAAKARRIRQLRDPECDAYQILESDMSELLRIGDEGLIVDELANKDWWKRQIDAMARSRTPRSSRPSTATASASASCV